MSVGYVAVQLLQNVSSYMSAIVITYVGLRNNYKGKWDIVKSEYNHVNSKYYHFSYTYLLSYINFYYKHKTQTKPSLNENAH
jgi:hypothetical protein